MSDKVIKGTIKTAGTATGTLAGGATGAGIGTIVCPGVGTAIGYLAGSTGGGTVAYKTVSKLLD